MKALLTAALLFSTSLLQADVPSLINYQGLLTDINGNVVSGSKSVSIAIFDAATSGTQLYSETIGSVTVQNGIYSFQFGSAPGFATALSTGAQQWLQVTIDSVAQNPRERLVTVPFAMKAQDAVTAGLNAAAEARVRTLEDTFLLTRLDDSAYRSLPKPSTPTTLAWDSFPVASGTNNRVTGSTSGSYSETQYSALGFTIQDLPELIVTGVFGDRIVKTLTVNGLTHRIEGDFKTPNANTNGSFTFFYTDSSSAIVYFTVNNAAQYENKVAINPYPTKQVSSIQITIRHNAAGTALKNIKIATPTAASVTLSLGPQSTNWTSFRASVIGAREAGDSVTYSITNGSTTLSNLSLDTLQTWNGSSAPTSMTLTLTPSATATVKGTSATTIGVFNQ